MRVKSCPVDIKAAGGHESAEGVFEAIVAAYNVDSGGDRIIPGAFAKTLAKWESSGDPIPIYWSHRMDDPDYNIGHVLEAKETDAGLWIRAQMDLDGPKAQQVYRLLKGRRVKQFSFSYDIEKAQPTTDDKSGEEILDLLELDLFEVGPTPIGMNQSTDLLAVKMAEAAERIAQRPVKAGAVTGGKADPDTNDPDGGHADESADDPDEDKSDADESAEDVKARAADLARAAQALLDALSGEQDPEPSKSTQSDDEAISPPAEPAATSPDGAKDGVPARPSVAADRLRTDLALLELEVDMYTTNGV